MTPSELKSWRQGRKLSQKGAAEAIGISERSLLAYEKPDAVVPLVVRLAVAGLDAQAAGDAAFAKCACGLTWAQPAWAAGPKSCPCDAKTPIKWSSPDAPVGTRKIVSVVR
jgi:DNA-binding XRE family transcriptional regulator